MQFEVRYFIPNNDSKSKIIPIIQHTKCFLQCFQVYQITDQSGDAILGCLNDRPIRCRGTFHRNLQNDFFINVPDKALKQIPHGHSGWVILLARNNMGRYELIQSAPS